MSRDILERAKVRKNDEFYTRIEDVAEEVKDAAAFFRGKRVLCDCDGSDSAFFKYFRENFETLGLASLTVRGFDESGSEGFEYVRDKQGSASRTIPKADADFRNSNSSDFDVVCTNPPFSLFREYFGRLVSSGVGFLVVGNQNMTMASAIYPRFVDGSVRLGNHKIKRFRTPGGGEAIFGNIRWFTNLKYEDKRPILQTTGLNFDPNRTYDNVPAIDCPKLSQIPRDFDGVLGVPLTFLEKRSEDFEIVVWNGIEWTKEWRTGCVDGRNGVYLKGVETYKRVFIRRRRQ